MELNTLGEVAEYINGRAFKPIEWEDAGLPIIRIQNLNDNNAKYNYTNSIFEDKYLARNGDLLFAWSASLGAFIWNGSDAWLNQHIFKVVPHIGTNKMYLFYYLIHVIDELYAKTHGSGMVHITLKPFKATAIPLPLLSEQQRIVKRIESLFEKLDHAKELAQSALDSFETRKAAILHRAFTGELIGLSGVCQCTLSELTKEILIGPFGTMLHADDYITDGIPVINPKHINRQIITPQENVTISKEKAVELGRYMLKENDIILGRRGEMGRTAPVTCEKGWICGTGSMIIRLKEDCIARVYSLILSSQSTVEYLNKNAVGSTMRNLNERIVNSIPVPIFSLNEQQKIAHILDSLFEKEQRAKELCNTIEKIDLMKKAILARAFRGELGTNDPTEESAVELLN